MTHLGEGTLQELLDGELPPGDARRRGGPPGLLSRVRRRAGGAARADGTDLGPAGAGGRRAAGAGRPGPVRAAPPRRRAHGRRAAPFPAPPCWCWPWPAPPRRPPSPARPRASGCAGWASASAPRSRRRCRPHAKPAAPAAEEMAPRAISILPSEGHVRIAVSASSPELRVRARLVPGARAEVTATGAAATARFRTGPGRIEVLGAGPGRAGGDPSRGRRGGVRGGERARAGRQGGRGAALAGAAGGGLRRRAGVPRRRQLKAVPRCTGRPGSPAGRPDR